jgi:ParB family chromosome partitioning protein
VKVANLKISEVKPYKSNPRINDDAIEIVAKSLEEFGFQQPLVLDKNKEIIVGHTRLLAAKNLKMETVPCVIAENLSDEKIKAYRIMDNKSAQYASWNYGLLTPRFIGFKL